MFNSIAEQLPASETHHMVKLIQAWRRESILPHAQLDNLESLIPGLAAAGAAAGAGLAGVDAGYEGSDTVGGGLTAMQQQLAMALAVDAGAGGSGSKGSAASPVKPQQQPQQQQGNKLTPAKRVSLR